MSHKHKRKPCPCGNGKSIYIRGVCQQCYTRVYRMVQAGDLTWKQAERKGMVLKPSGKLANCGRHRLVTASTLGSPYAKR